MPKITPEIEKRIREAAEYALGHGTRYARARARELIDALDDLAEARQDLDKQIDSTFAWERCTFAAEAQRNQMRRERDAALQILRPLHSLKTAKLSSVQWELQEAISEGWSAIIKDHLYLFKSG